MCPHLEVPSYLNNGNFCAIDLIFSFGNIYQDAKSNTVRLQVSDKKKIISVFHEAGRREV